MHGKKEEREREVRRKERRKRKERRQRQTAEQTKKSEHITEKNLINMEEFWGPDKTLYIRSTHCVLG